MNQFFITGTSSGIGLALAELLLLNPANHVTGISRRQRINHPQYTHLRLDLCKLDDVMDFVFSINGNEEHLALINNAGWIGEIAPMGSGSLDHDAIVESYNINLVSPTLLANQFISQVKDLPCRKTIINISSGAAQRPIASWSAYCASKAGLDMLTRVINAEHPGIACYAVAPGIVNTPMQGAIRNAKPEHFADLERFTRYYQNGDLVTPEQVDQKLVAILNNPQIVSENVFSLRDIILADS